MRRIRPMQPLMAAVVGQRTARAFTLVEVLIVVVILGILALVVVPKFSNASQQARENALRESLRLLRTQITLYAEQYGDVAPGYDYESPAATLPDDDEDFIDQLTKYTSRDGEDDEAFSDECNLGPYLPQIPVNPFNGKSRIRFTDSDMNPSSGGEYGWTYNPATQQIVADLPGLDGSGVAYASY